MPEILSYIFLLVGLVAGYLIYDVTLRRNRGLYNLMQLVRKRQMIAFLETDNATYFRSIERMYKNVGITPEKEIIIIPKGAAKPVMNLNGAQVIHGDLYRSIAVPQDLRKFIEEMKAGHGWKPHDTAKLLEEIEQTPSEVLEKIYKQYKESENYPGMEPKTKVTAKDKEKYNIFMGMSSVVKDFIYTGINRVSIAAMLRELVFQRELERVGQKNWMMIAVAILIILIGIGFAVRWITGGEGIGSIISAFNPVGPERVAP